MRGLRIVITIIIILIYSYLSIFFIMRYIDTYCVNFDKTVKLFITPDMKYKDVQNFLFENNLVKRKSSIKRTFKRLGLDNNKKANAGFYLIKEGSTSTNLAIKLKNALQSETRLTLSGTIRSKRKLAKQIYTQLMIDSLTIAKALNDSVFLAKYDLDTLNVYSHFLPDTYNFYWTADLKTIFDRFQAESNKFWNKERLAKLDSVHLTKMQVLTLASIVNGETLYGPEMPRIAGVYMNRLHKRMKLQADPTVAYCFDYKLDRILKIHTKFDSPFNTYMYFGLPPAPICVPTKQAINAVLNYENHKFLYFCASPDFNGSHLFAKNFVKHKENARRFQRALTIELRKRKLATK